MTAINKDQFSFINTGKYLSGQATKVFVSMPFPQHKEAVYKEVTLAAPINNGDTFITITEPLDVTLYEWTKLRLVPLVSEIDENAFGVFVFIETPAGETVIPIHPANGTAPAGKAFRLTSYIPVFSAKSVNIDNQSTMFIENNFSDLDIKTALTGVSASGTIEGAFIFGDPGNAVIQQAIKTARMVQLEVVTSDRKTSDTARVFLSANKQKGVNAFNTISYAWFADRMTSENILTGVMESEFGLSVDKTVVFDGDTFTVTFIGDESADYTITGVTSADIGGASLTGTFTASGEQLTFTANSTASKNFVLSLDNGKASVGVLFAEIICLPNTVLLSDNFNDSFSWNLSRIVYTGSNNSGNSSVSTTYNPSGFVEIRLDYGNVPANPASGIRGYWTSNLFYVPLSDNEIINLNFSVDRIGIDKSSPVIYSPAVYFYTVISGVIMIYDTSSVVTGGWSTTTLNNQLVTNAVAGIPIYFGLAHGAGTNNADALDPLFQIVGFDNYSVTVNVTCP